MQASQDSTAWLVLLHAPGLGPAHLSALLERFGDAAGIVCASRKDLRAAGTSDAAIEAVKHPDQSRIAKEQNWLAETRVHLLSSDQDDYPKLLREIPDPPPVLFVRGDPEVLSLPQLAIVGSRNPTPGGRETAAQFAAHLARCGLVITSGLALGIDSAAHIGALSAEGLTIAVCGTGLDRVYPETHTDLASRIVAEGGALISEFTPGTPPRRENFPRRNRLISGLALGTLVVEAAQRSGSLITARIAAEQGREVFAIPGSIHNPLSKGCHRLLREGAKLVESATDILEELGPALGPAYAGKPPPAPQHEASENATLSDPDYVKILEAVGFEPAPVDVIVQRSGLTASAVSSMLLILELNGYVISAPGGGYMRRHPDRWGKECP